MTKINDLHGTAEAVPFQTSPEAVPFKTSPEAVPFKTSPEAVPFQNIALSEFFSIL